MFKISYKFAKNRKQTLFYMAKIYYYLGIDFIFHKNDHPPIHIHGKRGEFESKAEIIVKNGKIIVLIKKVGGIPPLKGTDLKNFTKFVEKYSIDIIKKWDEFYNKGITPKTKRYETRIRRKNNKSSKGGNS
jgi:hypothetical protein